MSSHVTRRAFLDGAAITALASQSPAPAQTDASRYTPEGQRAQELIANMLNGYRLTQMIYVAATLGLADQLKDGPRTTEDLAATTGAHGDSLYRLLRALAGLGVFAEEDGKRFRLTPAAELLQAGAAGARRATAIFMGGEGNWRSWGDLLYSVRTGQAAFAHVYGKGDFEWFQEHPEEARNFDEFQAETTRRAAESIAATYDFSNARKVVDIGGGAGVLLAVILRRNTALRGVLFDLDHVIQAARRGVDPEIAPRCEFVGGDFFKAVPSGGDVYIVKYIIHDWDDARARTILGNVGKALSPRSKLLVIEQFICGRNQPCAAKINDVNMLVRTGGRNRTETEYRNLLASAGFTSGRIFSADQGLSILEAERAE